MNIKLEILQNHINDIIKIIMEDITPDMSKIADATAINILDEIKNDKWILTKMKSFGEIA